MSVKKVTTLRAMERFACLGSACEEHCCGGWSVYIDEAHFHRLERLLPASELARVVRSSDARNRKQMFAKFTQDEGHSCHFLDAAKLCTLHGRFGEAVLPDSCAVYPRVLARVGQRLEMWGSISCPEVARQLLLAEDGVELVELPPERAPRAAPQSQLHTLQKDAWYGLTDVIRGSMYRMLLRRELPLRARLFSLCNFAHATRTQLNFKANKLDVAPVQFELDCLENRDILREQAERLDATPPDPALGAAVISGLLAVFAADRDEPTSAWRLLVEIFGGGDNAFALPDPATLLARDEAALAAAPPEYLALLEGWLTRMAAEAVLRRWFNQSPDLVSYLHLMMVRLLLARVLLLCDPRLRAIDSLADSDERKRAWGARAVEVVYRIMRRFDHSDGIRETLEKSLWNQGYLTPMHSYRLAQSLVV